MAHAIDVRDLRRAYGAHEAVRGISFSVAPGEVFCLLGPNGAGKTTTTEILEGHRSATSGRVDVLGFDPARRERALRARIGVVLQDTALPSELTAAEVLRMHARWYPRPRDPQALLDLIGLSDRAGVRVKALSGGQRRRLDLAVGLVGDPDVLFLDEPTTGFDPSARRRSWATIRALCEAGRTVVLTTHFMDEAQALADRVAVMAAGQIVAQGTPGELGGRDTAPARIRFALPPETALADLPDVGAGASVGAPEPGSVEITAPHGVRAAHILTGWALERGLELRGFAVTQPTLEDVYLSLTADRADDREPAIR
jgi:ABC-2 type transport system ATP-binding protein